MLEMRRLPAAGLAAALALGGCMTPHTKIKPSQAVLDARAHKNIAAAPPCSAIPLSAVSPARLGFAFEQATMDEITTPALQQPVAWLACHPGVAAVVKPDADNHGTEAEQDALAARRGEAVAAFLRGRGVPPGQIRLLGRTQSEPAGEHLLILAEGRRW